MRVFANGDRKSFFGIVRIVDVVAHQFVIRIVGTRTLQQGLLLKFGKCLLCFVESSRKL